MHPDIVELGFRDLILDNDWVDFSGSDETVSITASGIREAEKRDRAGKITLFTCHKIYLSQF